MLPALDPQSSLEQQYRAYLDALAAQGFAGDIETRYSSRLAVATDNSIYQRLPQAVVLPRHLDDILLLTRVAQEHPLVKFSARGGGTGTNGQSLTSGVVVDLSRHMNKVLEINAEEGWARVQAGLVKDKLNDALRPHGFFFAPDLSTSNRATVGGMINTDASGQGSLVYGKTSDHVLGLTSVLVDGTLAHTAPMSMADAEQKAKDSDTLGDIVRQLLETCVGKRQQILDKFPRLNRFLTGYDLEHAYDEDTGMLDISRVITGSEGSLAFVAEAKINITPIARYKALINVKYDSFESALRHAPQMVAAEATSVETVDSKVLNLAKNDIIWHAVSDLIQDVPGKSLQGLNMVEYNSNDKDEIEAKLGVLCNVLDDDARAGRNGVIGYQLTYDVADITKIYAMRKKAVGLLGKADGWQKPIAFAEDTAVPPENLADFIMEFRALLDNHGLQYGMFGHVDAGVLHVRPALDMCDPKQQQLLKAVSDEVVALVAKYGGLMWGEHGKGYRSEYAPAFFGEELFTEIRKVKRAFDPLNRMNPGKICTPLESSEKLVSVSDPMRGDFDRQIPIQVKDAFEPAMSCNGNGLCYNYDTSSPMCPSSKVTGDRRHSPKGRAGMMREWLRLLSHQNIDARELETHPPLSLLSRWKNTLGKTTNVDFSHEVMEVMDGCLACKACANQCPVNVDVPSFRARFLSMYYQRYLRPAKDHLVANIEQMAPLMAKAPGLVNSIQKQPWFAKLVRKSVGYIDSPLLSAPSLEKRVSPATMAFDLGALNNMSEDEKNKTVLIVQDPFTSFYEAELIADLVKLTDALGHKAVILPFKPNGKPQHVKGFLSRFAKTAATTSSFLNEVAETGIPMMGVDASLVLCYRDEYRKVLSAEQRGAFNVQLVHEWLADVNIPNTAAQKDSFALFAHCTEKTALPVSEKQWQDIFARAGARLESVPVGCCGMAGTFGHEAKHFEESKGIYALSWQEKIARYQPHQVLATGYSCRSQVKRFEHYQPRHPLQALLGLLTK